MTLRTWQGPSVRDRSAILRQTTSVAIVGASENPARASYFVAAYLLQSSPYDVYFVNPRATQILGRPVYPSLAALPVVPDLVDVFRRPSDLGQVLEETVAVGAQTFWLQLGPTTGSCRALQLRTNWTRMTSPRLASRVLPPRDGSASRASEG